MPTLSQEAVQIIFRIVGCQSLDWLNILVFSEPSHRKNRLSVSKLAESKVLYVVRLTGKFFSKSGCDTDNVKSVFHLTPPGQDQSLHVGLNNDSGLSTPQC